MPKVIHIDLTQDEAKNQSETKNNKKIKKPSSRRLLWLKRIMSKSKVTKITENNENHVEIVDAHSTENCENTKNYKPVFVNEISESTISPLTSLNIEKFPITSGNSINLEECTINDPIEANKIISRQLSSPTWNNSEKIDKIISNSSSIKKKININTDNLSNLEICPVSTTVSSEDIPSPGFFWVDSNLFKCSEYDLIFDAQPETSNSLINKNRLIYDDQEKKETNLCATEIPGVSVDERINEYDNITISDRLLYDDMSISADNRILNVSPPIKRAATNWSDLFDYHLANIDSPENSLLSSVQFVDPRLTRKTKDNKEPLCKQNYMTCLGLSNRKEEFELDINETKEIFESSLANSFLELSSSTVLCKNIIENSNHSMSLPRDLMQDAEDVDQLWPETIVNRNIKISTIQDPSSLLSNVSSTTSQCNLTHTYDKINENILERRKRNLCDDKIEEPTTKTERKSPLKMFQHRRTHYLLEGMRWDLNALIIIYFDTRIIFSFYNKLVNYVC